MVIAISDFWGEHNKAALGQLNFKHDFIPIRIADPHGTSPAGRRARHPERPGNGQNMFLNPLPAGRPGRPCQLHAPAPGKWTQDFRRLGIDFPDLRTTDNFMPPLQALFARRSCNSPAKSPFLPPCLHQLPSSHHPRPFPNRPSSLPLMETQAPDAYLHAGFWDTWESGLRWPPSCWPWPPPSSCSSAKKGRTAPALDPGPVRRPRGHHHAQKHTVPQAGRRGLLPYPAKSSLVGKPKTRPCTRPSREFNRRADALTALSTELQGPTRDLLDRMAVLKYRRTPRKTTPWSTNWRTGQSN